MGYLMRRCLPSSLSFKRGANQKLKMLAKHFKSLYKKRLEANLSYKKENMKC